MDRTRIANASKRIVLGLLAAGATMIAFGGCGMREIGLGLLSDFLTSGNGGLVGSTIDSGLASMVGQLIGGAT